MRQRLATLKNTILGAVLTQGVLSLLIVGWTWRMMQRETFRTFHRAASTDQGFAAFCGDSPATRELTEPPTWLLGPGGGGLRGRLRPLWLNLRVGAAALFNTWVLTLPGCALWLFSWYDGWNNSFHKGYEQAAVGPLTGLLGVALFIVAMLYVPMAQARHAATGRWRDFWQFSLVRDLVRRRGFGCVRLAALYAALGFVVVLLKTAPIAFDRSDAYAALADAEVLASLETWFLASGVFVFWSHVIVHRAAARLYASALVEAVRGGDVPLSSLAPIERDALGRLGFLEVEPAAPVPAVVRAAKGTARLGLRGSALAALVGLWFAFVAQVYVSEFLNHHPVIGWLNQPLVQVPFFRYVPDALQGG